MGGHPHDPRPTRCRRTGGPLVGLFGGFDRSACHLDLVQWATHPIWGGLDDVVRARLLAADRPFLVRQLEREQYRTVVVNGRTALRWVERAGLVRWCEVGRLAGPPPAVL